MSNVKVEGLVLEPRVIARIREVQRYIQRMRLERMGWGPEAMQEADETMLSWVNGMSTLMEAERVWIDGTGPQAFSFGGVLPGGIYFGMIARKGFPSCDQFENCPITWTFHS